jgi:hypothetical protein
LPEKVHNEMTSHSKTLKSSVITTEKLANGIVVKGKLKLIYSMAMTMRWFRSVNQVYGERKAKKRRNLREIRFAKKKAYSAISVSLDKKVGQAQQPSRSVYI